MDPFVGEIRPFGFSFAPKGWATCNGQLIAISQNTALFSLLGTTYGGDGKSTFALPNLMGSLVVHPGQGPGQTWYLGEMQGSETVQLQPQQMPLHTHTLTVTSNSATTTLASNTAQLAKGFEGNLQGSVATLLYSNSAPNQPMAPASLSPSGGTQPHGNMMPYLTLSYCIALVGQFPQRN